jgi:hypothetical protein
MASMEMRPVGIHRDYHLDEQANRLSRYSRHVGLALVSHYGSLKNLKAIFYVLFF